MKGISLGISFHNRVADCLNINTVVAGDRGGRNEDPSRANLCHRANTKSQHARGKLVRSRIQRQRKRLGREQVG